jgi:DNA-directed RNA polymerase specialized sigma24 family protein
MDDSQDEGTRRRAAEELILRTIAAHADSLLRTARRHSICVDDAQDAYQRSIEIFMAHAQRLDAGHAAGWLHVVVKREAQAIRQARQKLLLSSEVDLDGQECPSLPTPEERLLSFDMVSRSAEALKRLKPNELRALWLRAQGHSYSEIAAMTGWSYSKVNRCMTEGRRSFLERYEGIESGAECERWLPVISALVDGEATPEQVLELRPHLRNCPGCRATLKALQDSTTPLAALLPVPLVVADGGSGDYLMELLMRLYEGIAGGLHERAVNSITKAQALIEASASGKVAAVAASAAAVAGGGYASAEQAIERPAVARHLAHALVRVKAAKPPGSQASAADPAAVATSGVGTPATGTATPSGNESHVPSTSLRLRYAPAFRTKSIARSSRTEPMYVEAAAYAPARWDPRPTRASPTPRAAPAFAPQGPATEFGP